MRPACLCLLAGLLPVPAAADLSGRVVAVASGDSLTVLVNEREQVNVRLLGIDAPEPHQELGKQSQSGLAAHTFGRDVRLEGERRDRSGKVLAKVWVAEAGCRQPDCAKTVDVGLAQMAAGLAWHDQEHARGQSAADRQVYAEAEFMAKIRRQGLWAAKHSTVPSDWQRRRLDE